MLVGCCFMYKESRTDGSNCRVMFCDGKQKCSDWLTLTQLRTTPQLLPDFHYIQLPTNLFDVPVQTCLTPWLVTHLPVFAHSCP